MLIYISAPHSNWAHDAMGGRVMKLYLAGVNSRPYIFENDEIKIFLAGAATGNNNYLYRKGVEAVNKSLNCYQNKIYVLESFYYVQDWMLPFIKDHWHFLLDSGAFTFMENAKITPNWDEYIERYATFINENNIDLFFELDLDSVVGLKEVERLRDKLETLTNKKSIPVWHKSRGQAYWLKMCEDYDYVAIGGIASGEIKKDEYKFFPTLLNLAKERGAKVHGLGFTNLEGLKKYKFYSVDSTAWIYGNRAGFVYWFNGETLQKVKAKPGQRMKARETAIHNFNEWVKFQRYAEVHL